MRIQYYGNDKSPELVQGDKGTFLSLGKDENGELIIEVKWDSGANAVLKKGESWKLIDYSE